MGLKNKITKLHKEEGEFRILREKPVKIIMRDTNFRADFLQYVSRSEEMIHDLIIGIKSNPKLHEAFRASFAADDQHPRITLPQPRPTALNVPDLEP